MSLRNADFSDLAQRPQPQTSGQADFLEAMGGGPQAYLNADARSGSTDNGKPSYTIDAAANVLVRGDPGWGTSFNTPYTVSYAYRASAPATMPSDTSGFQAFTAKQIDQTELALRAWSDVANIHFQRVGSGDSGFDAYSNNATILLGGYTSGEVGSAAFSYYPGSTAYSSSAGDVWVNSSYSYSQNPTLGNYGAQVLVHEIGHAIGLAHPSDYNASAGQTLTYAADASYYEDDRQYTVMSYFSETNTGANFGGVYSAAPLLDDIAAAQLEYGANMSTRTGDTVYGFNANADEPWYVASSSTSKLVFAIWDAGGNDTLDVSGYSQAATIDLRQGFFSNVGGLSGNIAIAEGAVIENAIGGSGSDAIHGNDVANHLMGNAGDDTLVGGGGDDLLDGGPGADVASYGAARSGYQITPGFGGVWTIQDLAPSAPDGRDTLINVETAQFTTGSLALPDAVTAFELVTILRLDPLTAGAALETHISAEVSSGQASGSQVVQELIAAARATSSVATLAYQFFTGSAPTAAGMDYLVSPTGPNPNNLNAAYYQSFNLENRYINFAVNLGKAGAGAARFGQGYEPLSLFDATRQAYASIFGGAPSDAKLHALLDTSLSLDGVTLTRSDYFALYGGDGPAGIGAKAAMVGWLLAEAAKADLGVYALSNDAYLSDLATHNAALGVDIVGHYAQPGFTYLPG